jgi:hypothetical protein
MKYCLCASGKFEETVFVCVVHASGNYLVNTTGETSGFCCDMVVEASALPGCYIV